MHHEVECKARVEDPAALAAVLDARHVPAGPFVKRDVYYAAAGGTDAAFRLRDEDGRAVVTWKGKALRAGVELNEELEFGVESGPAFADFARRLGFVELVSKVKTGRAWRTAEGLTVELALIEGLGDYVEIERLVEDGDPAALAAAEAAVRAELAALGIDASRIEPRYYIDMLRGI